MSENFMSAIGQLLVGAGVFIYAVVNAYVKIRLLRSKDDREQKRLRGWLKAKCREVGGLTCEEILETWIYLNPKTKPGRIVTGGTAPKQPSPTELNDLIKEAIADGDIAVIEGTFKYISIG